MAVQTTDILGTGRRKTSVARVRVRPGDGKIVINERTLEEYFHNLKQRNAVLAPLEQTGKRNEVDIRVRVEGGGITGQADACKLGIARALKKIDDTFTAGSARHRHVDSRRPHERTQKIRSSRCAARHAVLEALIDIRRFDTSCHCCRNSCKLCMHTESVFFVVRTLFPIATCVKDAPYCCFGSGKVTPRSVHT